jgi:zinc transporter ZupT
MTPEGMNLTRSAASASGRPRRALVWLTLSALAAALGWLAFRGYLNPELLFHFANALYC